MPRYQIFGVYSASRYLGDVEAASEADAIEQVEASKDPRWHPYVSLCHQCSGEVEVGDIEEIMAFQIPTKPNTEQRTCPES